MLFEGEHYQKHSATTAVNMYTSLRILALNDGTLLATKSCDALHHLGSCNSWRNHSVLK